MTKVPELLDGNRAWAESVSQANPDFFDNLSKGQSPRYLWIGCSDSRVPAAQVCGLVPGEMFVHRNIANVVNHSDMSMLSVLQYAVQVLKVSDVIVCGHYGCGGVQAALGNQAYGLIDNWLRHIKDVADRNHTELAALEADAKFSRMCELNVVHQAANVCRTTIIQDAWNRGQKVAVHGLIHDLKTGRLTDLDVSFDSAEQLPPLFRMG